MAQDLSDLAGGGEEHSADEEELVDLLIEAGEERGVDLSALAAGVRRRGPTADPLVGEIQDVEDGLRLILNQLRFTNRRVEEETDPWQVAQFPADETQNIPTTTELAETQNIEAQVFQEATAHFQSTGHLVDLRISIDNTRVVPEPSADADWVTLAQASPVFDISTQIGGQQVPVTVTWRNRDNTNPHRVPVFLEYTD